MIPSKLMDSKLFLEQNW